MSDIEEYKFSDDDIISDDTEKHDDGTIMIHVRQDVSHVFFEGEDVEAMAKHFGIIE